MPGSNFIEGLSEPKLITFYDVSLTQANIKIRVSHYWLGFKFGLLRVLYLIGKNMNKIPGAESYLCM